MSSSSITADGDATLTMIATVTDGNGSPKSNYTVSFDADYGIPDPYIKTTDINGIATCSYSTIDEGTYDLYVYGATPDINDQKPVTGNAPSNASTIDLSITPASPPYHVTTQVTISSHYDSKKKASAHGYVKPYRVQITITDPTNTDVKNEFTRDVGTGDISLQTTLPQTGTWTITATLSVLQRSKGDSWNYKPVATSSTITLTVS